MLDFIKRVAIGVAIAMCVFFLKSQVFALTVDSRLQYVDNGSTVNTSYVSAGTLMSITPATGHEVRFTRVFVRFNESFGANTYYRFEYQYNVSRYDYEFLNHECNKIQYSVSIGAEISSVSCTYSGPTQNINIVVHFTESMSSVTIGSIYNILLLPNQTYNFRVVANSWNITNIDNTYDAIINNTAQITDAIEGVSQYVDYQTAVIETIRDMIYDFTYATIGDEPADIYSDYNYSGVNVNGYDSAHTSGTGAGGSGVNGANGLGFNFNPFTAPFTFIFSKVEDFLSLNATFMIYLINMITLGFIGLVLNR